MLYGNWHVHGRRGEAWNCYAPWLSAICYMLLLHALRFGFSQLKKRPVPLVKVVKYVANFGENKMVIWGFWGVLQSRTFVSRQIGLAKGHIVGTERF